MNVRLTYDDNSDPFEWLRDFSSREMKVWAISWQETDISLWVLVLYQFPLQLNYLHTVQTIISLRAVQYDQNFVYIFHIYITIHFTIKNNSCRFETRLWRSVSGRLFILEPHSCDRSRLSLRHCWSELFPTPELSCLVSHPLSSMFGCVAFTTTYNITANVFWWLVFLRPQTLVATLRSRMSHQDGYGISR